MFKELKILDESDKRLRVKSEKVTFPLSTEYKKLIKQIIKHLKYSQIEETQKKYNLRPGMGLAFVQLGIHKQIIVIVEEVEENVFETMCNKSEIVITHWKIAPSREGCLSVNRELMVMLLDTLE